MAKQAVSTGEILHAVGVRIRATGSGTLQLFMNSLDAVNTSQLPSITMAATTNKEVTQLANFKDQYMQVEGRTTAINETFNISKIIVFIKPYAAEYPR